MTVPVTPTVEPLYPFTVAEIRRLWACRQAILFGYYSDEISDDDE